MQVLFDGPAHECCMNFHTADICVVTMKSDFFRPFHKNILTCIFTSCFYLCWIYMPICTLAQNA